MGLLTTAFINILIPPVWGSTYRRQIKVGPRTERVNLGIDTALIKRLIFVHFDIMFLIAPYQGWIDHKVIHSVHIVHRTALPVSSFGAIKMQFNIICIYLYYI